MHASTTQRARALAAALACGGLLGAACTHPAPVHPSGLTGLGATVDNWNAVHSAAGGPNHSYGPDVDTGAGSLPTYSGVTFSAGHVVGWVMAFPAGTRLISAEHALGADLPSDTEQTASLRQSRQSGPGACEVVSYQSIQLRLAVSSDSSLAAGKFSVSFFDVQPGGSVSESYAKVDRAVVGAPASVPSPTCP